jgi:hypothetical protein
MKLSKKYKKFYLKEMKKYNKIKKFVSRHQQLQQLQQAPSPASRTIYKLPILTQVELVRDDTPSGQHIFYDYLLVPSKSKFKYLLSELFDQVKLDANNDKLNMKIVDGKIFNFMFGMQLSNLIVSFLKGFLKVKNWQPVSLNSISHISQCHSKSSGVETGTNSDLKEESAHKPVNNGDNSSSTVVDLNTNKHKSRKTSDGKSSGSGAKSRNSSSSSSLTLSSSSESNNNSRSNSINNASRASSLSSSSLSVSSSSESSSVSSLSNLGMKRKRKAKNSSSHSATVGEILSHVIGFSTITIKVKLK